VTKVTHLPPGESRTSDTLSKLYRLSKVTGDFAITGVVKKLQVKNSISAGITGEYLNKCFMVLTPGKLIKLFYTINTRKKKGFFSQQPVNTARAPTPGNE
jgi:hypothetical protein